MARIVRKIHQPEAPLMYSGATTLEGVRKNEEQIYRVWMCDVRPVDYRLRAGITGTNVG